MDASSLIKFVEALSYLIWHSRGLFTLQYPNVPKLSYLVRFQSVHVRDIPGLLTSWFNWMVDHVSLID